MYCLIWYKNSQFTDWKVKNISGRAFMNKYTCKCNYQYSQYKQLTLSNKCCSVVWWSDISLMKRNLQMYIYFRLQDVQWAVNESFSHKLGKNYNCIIVIVACAKWYDIFFDLCPFLTRKCSMFTHWNITK
jgi:hypothetical protein